MLGRARGTFRPLSRALAAPFLWLHVPADVVTFLTLVPAGFAVWAISADRWALALGLGMVTGFLDLADGAVARARGKLTALGGFLDSLVDRIVDALFLFALGFAVDTREGWVVVAAAVIGSYGTSYARARVYEDRPDVPADTWHQFFERPERLIVLSLAVLAEAIAWSRGLDPDHRIVFYGLVVVAVGSLFTLAQRVGMARRLLKGVASRRDVTPGAARAPSSRTGPSRR